MFIHSKSAVDPAGHFVVTHWVHLTISNHDLLGLNIRDDIGAFVHVSTISFREPES